MEVGSGPEEPGGKGPERNREHVIYSMFVLDAVALSAEKRIEFTPPAPTQTLSIVVVCCGRSGKVRMICARKKKRKLCISRTVFTFRFPPHV